jgi:hypothetical protein
MMKLSLSVAAACALLSFARPRPAVAQVTDVRVTNGAAEPVPVAGEVAVSGGVDVLSLPEGRTHAGALATQHVTLRYDPVLLHFVRVHLNGNAAPAPYVVPQGFALVLTDAAIAVPSSASIPELLALTIHSSLGNSSTAIAATHAVHAPGAPAFGSIQLPGGALVGPGRSLRAFFEFMNGGGGNQLRAIAHGYLVPLVGGR